MDRMLWPRSDDVDRCPVPAAVAPPRLRAPRRQGAVSRPVRCRVPVLMLPQMLEFLPELVELVIGEVLQVNQVGPRSLDPPK